MKNHEFDIIDQYIKDKQKNAVLDIGANVGAFAKYYSNKFKHVHSFEPVSTTHSVLEKNLSNYDNVLTYNVAIGDKVTDVDIVNLEGHSTRNKVQDSTGQAWLEHRIKSRNLAKGKWKIETVAQRTIDSYDFQHVDLIKIDTEGYVLPVINGMIDTVTRCKPVLYVELHDNTPNKDKCFSLLENLSYKKEYVDNLNHIFFM